MSIKYTPSFNKQISSTVGAYNKRVKRLMAKYPTSRRVPPLVSVKGLKTAYSNRKDLIAKLNQLESFNEKSLNQVVSVSRDNVRTNKYEFKSFLLNQRVARERIQHLIQMNQQRDRQEGRFLPSHRTRSLKAQLKTLERGVADNATYQQYLASRNVASRYTDRREQSDKQFYDNFFDMLWANQQYADLDPEIVQKAQDMLSELSPEQLLELYNREPDISRLVEDYNLYNDTQGATVSELDSIRARVRFENLMDELPALIDKYKRI